MATLALPLPFAQVEESVEFVSLAVRIARRRNELRAWMCKLHLTLTLHEIAALQGEIIQNLDAGCVNRLTPEQLIELAAQIDEMVEICNSGLAEMKQENFRTWQGYLQQISEQVERLDNLAESFRESASADHTAYIGELVKSASMNGSHKVESWSEFVASLQD